MLAPFFRADHERQVRALFPCVAGLGFGAPLALLGLTARPPRLIIPI